MGIKYLLDTNVVSKYFFNQLNENIYTLIDHLAPSISVISQIELLSYPSFTSDELAIMNQFISDATIYPLDENVVNETIKLRKKYKIKTPDAIIAATALVHGLKLITIDKDFQNIKGLDLILS